MPKKPLGHDVRVLNYTEVDFVEYQVGDQKVRIEKYNRKLNNWDIYQEGLFPRLVRIWAEEGLSMNEINLRFCVARKTFLRWQERDPEFLEACEYAKLLFVARKEKLAWEHMVEKKDGPKLNANLFRFMMSAVDRENYAPPTVLQATGEPAETIEVVQVSQSLRDTYAQIEERIRDNPIPLQVPKNVHTVDLDEDAHPQPESPLIDPTDSSAPAS